MRKLVLIVSPISFWLLSLIHISNFVYAAPVAGHNAVIEFYNLTPTQLNAAKSKTLLFYHQSTGNGIEFFGLDCLNGEHNGWDGQPAECANNMLYNPYDDRKWDWKMWPEPMADAIAKMNQFLNLVNTDNNAHQVYGMKFCFVDGWNINFDDYRTKMENLEKSHPNKIFIWATEILNTADHVNNEAIQDFNDNLRPYARANNKPLLDLAAIESRDGQCHYTKNGRAFEVLCPEYWDNPSTGGSVDGHPDADGSLAMAKGLWWLMANLEPFGPVPTPTPSSRYGVLDFRLAVSNLINIFGINTLIANYGFLK